MTVDAPRVKNDSMREEAGLLAAGVWGGKGARMEVSERGALLEFGFAKGSITRPVALDAEGRFSAPGEFEREGFGSRDEDAEPARMRAVYSGAVEGDEMTLNVTLAETGESFGAFRLTRGGRGRVWNSY